MDGTAVVTGASSGIGEAIARQLLESGCTVVALQRRPPRLQHPRLQFYAVDLAEAAAARKVADEVAAQHPVRYLVNNAGVNRPGLLEQATVDDIDYALAVNVRAAVLLAQAFVPGMRAARFGRIVNISSRAATGKTGRTAYSAAKAGLIGLTRTWCLELAAAGVTVNAVAPGPVATELFDRGHPPGSAKRQQVIDGIPVKRVGTPDDIARSVMFLLAPDSGYITGQTLFVCGGTSVSGTGGELTIRNGSESGFSRSECGGDGDPLPLFAAAPEILAEIAVRRLTTWGKTTIMLGFVRRGARAAKGGRL